MNKDATELKAGAWGACPVELVWVDAGDEYVGTRAGAKSTTSGAVHMSVIKKVVSLPTPLSLSRSLLSSNREPTNEP
jgi:hypothetical protein